MADTGKKVFGESVKSPHWWDYELPHVKTVDYSSRVKSMSDLTLIANKYFYENPKEDEPVYTISIDTIENKNKKTKSAKIGDVARVYDPDFDIATEQIVFERTFDSDREINTNIKVGTYQQTIFRYLENRISKLENQIN